MRTPEEIEVGSAAIRLMRGVVYRENDEETWRAIERHPGALRDHFQTIGIDVVTDESEGYAFLRSQDDGEDPELPRLVHRRSLTYPVSVLLVLLRERLAVFENVGGEGKLVLTRDQIVEMMRLYLSATSNEARVVDTIETTIRKVAELGFVRALRGQPDHWEVRRIIKAYVDAQTLDDFAGTLRSYAQSAGGTDDE